MDTSKKKLYDLPAVSAKFIADSMKHVQVNDAAVETLAQLLLDKVSSSEYDIAKWKADNALHPQAMNEHSVEWIFLVDSLNFSFWPDAGQEFTIQGEIGYWALCAAVNRALEEKVPITEAKFYQNLSTEEAAHIFRTDQEGITIPMLKERLQVLHQNGKTLVEKFGGSFVNCIAKANGSAFDLISIIYDNFPSFRDEGIYNGKPVTFLKRAQILVADLWGCFEGESYGRFKDIEKLTMFADYRIPQVLHYFGVLQYSEELSRQLRSQHLLENGSTEEMEIRGASIHAVELIRGKMVELASRSTASSVPVPNSIQIDFYLWGFRRDNATEIDIKSPYHKVRSIFY
ncbi:hypothetical protein TYRP_010773 [Tyrophagus putrescentiae]|nr:hypothetical protein TYRP_010773 [Tyrophagus putrescentiae]